ncbi:hypothetical protein WME95_03750 [Sorangium sp. So ce327]|uniref:hypothetical protein n=1 Tax=Sorangium sp. So ce327 TaxID=3133301 RepID=UPI003F5F1A52
MRIAILSTYTHPSRLLRKERSNMQSSVPELLAALCPPARIRPRRAGRSSAAA